MYLPESPESSHFLHRHRSGKQVDSKVEIISSKAGDRQADTSVDRALYAGILFGNFGHFISESLGRLWPILSGQLPRDISIVYHPYGAPTEEMKVEPYVRDTFSYLGLDPDRIVFANRCLRVSELIVPAQAKILGMAPNREGYYAMFDEYAERAGTVEGVKHVYVSRSNYLSSGSFVGETVLERHLARHGIHVHYPERHTVAESIRLYRSAESLIFSEGSAIHLLEISGRISADVMIVSRRAESFVRQIFADPLKDACSGISVFPAKAALTPLHWNAAKNAPTISMGGAVVDLNVLLAKVSEMTSLEIPPLSAEAIREGAMLDAGKMLFSSPLALKDDERLGQLFRKLHAEFRQAFLG